MGLIVCVCVCMGNEWFVVATRPGWRRSSPKRRGKPGQQGTMIWAEKGSNITEAESVGDEIMLVVRLYVHSDHICYLCAFLFKEITPYYTQHRVLLRVCTVYFWYLFSVSLC